MDLTPYRLIDLFVGQEKFCFFFPFSIGRHSINLTGVTTNNSSITASAISFVHFEILCKFSLANGNNHSDNNAPFIIKCDEVVIQILCYRIPHDDKYSSISPREISACVRPSYWKRSEDRVPVTVKLFKDQTDFSFVR